MFTALSVLVPNKYSSTLKEAEQEVMCLPGSHSSEENPTVCDPSADVTLLSVTSSITELSKQTIRMQDPAVHTHTSTNANGGSISCGRLLIC